MKAQTIEARVVAVPYPMGRMLLLDASEAMRRFWAGFAAVMRFCNSSRMLGWLFCVSLWVSSLLAVWMTLGWVGLFMSGHVLSAGTYWVRGLARRTPAATTRGSRESGSARAPLGSAS